MSTKNIRKAIAISIICPRCLEASTVLFEADPFLDSDFVFCPRCGKKVER